MRNLFDLDVKNYDPDGSVLVRPSARGIIIKDGKVAMVHSLRYNYYKFPGGGLEPGEDAKTALIREVREEAGLKIIPDSIREYGMVRRMQKLINSDYDHLYQENLYFLCDAVDKSVDQDLDDYEAEAGYMPEWVEPAVAIKANRSGDLDIFVRFIRERECRILEMLMEEGYFDSRSIENN